MTYANSERRSAFIDGLRALADFLDRISELPAPYSADFLVFPGRMPDEDGRAEIDRIAGLLDVSVQDDTADFGHYSAGRPFGPVAYRAVYIPSDVIPATDQEA